MRKRIMSLLLAVCMTLSLLPTTAFAAISDLLDNSPAENQALLEQLEALTGQDAEAIQALLEQYGLLDENGNLVTDRTIDLDGVSYTLEEMEALLSDPATDLSRVGYVDGVPISLGDLKTIIAIERELQRIQETYFSGRTFEGEALENLNSLMAQLQSQGITLMSEDTALLAVPDSGVRVADVRNFTSCGSGVTVSTTIDAKQGDTLSVKVAYDPGLANFDSVTVTLGTSTAELTSSSPSTTLSYPATADGNVTLSVTASSISDDAYNYGTLTGAVQFTEPQGFMFKNGNSYNSAHTVLLTRSRTAPALYSNWSGWNSTWYSKENVSTGSVTLPLTEGLEQANPGMSTANATRAKILEVMQILQGARTGGNGLNFTVGVKLQIASNGNYGYLTTKSDTNGQNFSFSPSSDVEVLKITDENGNELGSKIKLDTQYVCFYLRTKSGSNAMPESLIIKDPFLDGGTSTAKVNMTGLNVHIETTALNDGAAPRLISVTAPAGTYYPGQRIPITLYYDELVWPGNGSISINGRSFSASELSMNSMGNKIILWYPVQQADNRQLVLTSFPSVKDYWNNTSDAINGRPISDVAIESVFRRDAATGVSADYNVDAETATVTVTLSNTEAYVTDYTNYHQPTDGSAKEVPFRAVITNSSGTTVATMQVCLDQNDNFTTEPCTIARQDSNQTYTVTLQVNEGTRDNETWSSLSYRSNLQASFTVPALIPADKVVVTEETEEANYTLSLAAEYRPTLTAEVYGPDGTTPATFQSGTWSSSDTDIATITTEADYSGKVTLTGKKVGTVTFTFTADNGTPGDTEDDKKDDKTGTSRTYTVVAGDYLALVIPAGASTIVARQKAAATVLWSSNASLFAPDKEFSYTIEVFEGNFASEAQLTGEPVWETTADKNQNSVQIEENVLSNLSNGSIPAYTVRVSMPHPLVTGEQEVRLSTLAWIVVQPVPAKAILTPPESLYLLDTAGTVQIPWAAENLTEGSGQTVTLTVTRVTGDNQSITETHPLTNASGTYTLNLEQVADDNLKDTYQIMLSVNNPGEEIPSTDSFPLYVYNGDALKIQDSQGNDLPSLTLDNTSKVSGDLPKSTADIMNLRQALGLIEYVNINYEDYNWNTYRDGIKWTTSNDDVVSVNYKQGTLYENINLFGYETYLPGTTMALSSTVDGKATITATHATTDMYDTVEVEVTTLRNKFFLFQVSPAVETTLHYVDGNGKEQTATTNDQGVLALYDPNGIASDVWFSSETSDGQEYMGTIYRQNLQSGEQNATMLQLYPLNTITLRPAAKAELTLLKPDGSPLAGTNVTVRGGVFKNGYYCETSGIGEDHDSINTGGADQEDVIFTTDSTGKIVVYFDATQFWSAAAGENENTQVLHTDQFRYVLEIRDIENNTYYPVFQTVNASASVEQEMRTASGVVVLEKVPSGEEDKPFVAQQIVDYGLDNGVVLDVRTSTGKAGPTKTYPEATLVTTMFLWGMDSTDGQNCDLKITDENGYIPSNQTSSVSRYPFTSIPVVENTISLTAETMTDSGWISDGKDMGVKTRLTKSGTLVRERILPFRVMDLTRIPAVNEEEDISQMLVTLTSSAVVSQANFESSNSIMRGLSGVLNGLSGPINSSTFKMIITPTNDPTVFNALIWTGYDSLELEDVDYVDGIAFETDYLNQKLEVGVPGVNDLADMANGTYNPSQTIQQNASKVTSADAELKLQLTGYYEAEIRYNLEQKKWEIYTTGGGFTAGVGMEIGFTVNASVGPVPVTGSFSVGGAIQLDFQTAVRYSQQGNNIWSDPDATAVNDYLTNLRINAYVKAFGGVGFDFSVIALKIGLYGKLGVDSQNKFLSRTYLQNSGDRQLNGQHLQTTGEVGIKFVAKFLFVSYELNLVSAGFSSGASFNEWGTIENYWNSATSGLSLQSLQYAAALNGMQVASASATLQSLDYLDAYARSWGQPQTRAALFSLDENNGLANLQTNANPNSYPEISDDGQVLVYVNDGYSDSNKTPSIYDSRAHYSTLSGGSYSASTAISDPDDFTGYGDSDVDIAGSSSFAAASWVRMSSDLPGKDAGDAVSVEEQNLLMNSAEIVASIYRNGGWTSTRLTTNGTPDLAPAVASNGTDRAVVFWRSVYSADPENGLMDFTAQDQILYSVYNGVQWSKAKTLYNGSNGSVKALEAAMLPDGTAVAVYTLDKSGTGDTTQYEVGYTIVNADNGSLGTSMLVTSDKYLDENPQVVSASFGSDDRFVIAWHSLRNDVSDIQMLAVDKDGVMSNSFPASLSEITSDGSAAVSASFRLATLSGSYRDVTNLTVIWDETAENNSVLKAARLRSNDSTGYVLSAPMELATLGDRTMADHFEAYVSGDNQIKAIIQATQYGTNIENDIPKTTLYTATSQFALDAVEVEAIVPDYAKLALESMVAVQFVVRNTGLNNVENLTVTMGSGETATFDQTLLPNQSATLIVLHQIGDTVENASYTITADNDISESGTVYLDYPDIGISRMEVLKEEGGQRTVSMTLYNASAAALAGKGREVKLAFYTDNLLAEAANVTYNGISSSNTVTISNEADLKRIDEGSFTLEVTYDVGAYVKGQSLSEIPDSGVYLYADAWVEGKIGTQSGNQRLPEYSSADNQSSVLLTGAMARTGKVSTLNVEQGLSDGVTTATVTLTNNSLQPLSTPTLVATLLDANGQPLETKTTSISGTLDGETSQASNITFSKAGSRVTVQALTGEDSLTFEGLPVSMEDFTAGEDGTLTCSISGISVDGTLVTAASGSGGKVSINGTESDGTGSLYVPIGAGTTVITVTIGAKTYVLNITSTHSSGGGGTFYYGITVESTGNGKVTASRSSAGAGSTITLTASPEEGFRLASLTVTDKNGKTVALKDKGDGTYTFTMPGSAVTVKAAFVSADAEDLPFVDVPAGAWYEEGVRYVYTNGLMNGTSATTFSPNATTTRSMIATILWRLEGSPEAENAASFTDVAADTWYSEAVQWAASAGIVTGYGDNRFGPSDPITREQMATMLYRYAQYKDYDVSVGEDTNILSYTDFEELGEYAIPAMQWAAGAGIINGTSADTLSPRGSAVRSQVAVILMRYCENIAK